jgi:ligand-binding sensor domain-containing protein
LSTWFKYYVIAFLSWIANCEARAQLLSFHQLSVKEGLHSNSISYACFDSTGLMWMSSNDGLISYDGVSINQYLKETHTGLPDNAPASLLCDSHNRIWVCTNAGLAIVNERRKIERVIIADSLKNAAFLYCIEIKGLGILAFEQQRTYLQKEGETKWIHYEWFDRNIRQAKSTSNVQLFNDHACLLILDNRITLVDLLAQKKLVDVPIKNVRAVCPINDKELIAVCDKSWGIYKINIASNSIVKDYQSAKDQYNVPLAYPCTYASRGTDGKVYISTRFAGLIQYDPATEAFNLIQHDPLNEQSICTNALRRVFTNKKGSLVITSNNGISYTNVAYNMFRQQNYFKDKSGNIYDGTVVGIATTRTGTVWISNYAGIFIYDPASSFVTSVARIKNTLPFDKIFGGAGGICKDKQGNIWASADNRNLTIYSPDGKPIRELTTKNNNLPPDDIRLIRAVNDTLIAVGTEKSLYFVNTKTFRQDTLPLHPALKEIQKKRTVDIMPDGHRLWVASSPKGNVACYDFLSKELKVYTEQNGLSSNRVYCLGKDLHGTIYAGTYDGLNIISPDGKIKVINSSNGLRHPRIDNIITDNNGYVWITNLNSLIRLNPADNSLTYFDERNGINNSGFTIASNSISKDNIIYVSSADGILIINANQTFKPFQSPGIVVHQVFSNNEYEKINRGQTISLSYKNARLNLYYITEDFISANRYLYRYKLEGLDKGWSAPTKNHQLTYNLQPGKYTFRLQTAFNEKGWGENETIIYIIVSPPFWQTAWFRILSIVFTGLLVYLIYRRRVQVIKTKAAIKQQMAELEGKALRAQMNPHFIFNSLNAIQELVVTENYTGSYQYLSKFSKLLRMVLNNSEKNAIPLSSEIEMNQLYLELESLRFKQSFHYSILVDENLDPDSVEFPSLLLQPFIENAIWHGLMHKEGEKKLKVSFSTTGDKLFCEIEDNGIGREKAAIIKAQKLGAHHFDSKGTQLALQRIETLQHFGFTNASIHITDMVNDNNQPSGTKVTIAIPIIKIFPA